MSDKVIELKVSKAELERIYWDLTDAHNAIAQTARPFELRDSNSQIAYELEIRENMLGVIYKLLNPDTALSNQSPSK